MAYLTGDNCGDLKASQYGVMLSLVSCLSLDQLATLIAVGPASVGFLLRIAGQLNFPQNDPCSCGVDVLEVTQNCCRSSAANKGFIKGSIQALQPL